MSVHPPTVRLRTQAPALALLLVATLVVCSGCGRKGAPLAPLRHIPEPPTGVDLRQRGDSVLLRVKLPSRYADGKPLEGTPSILLFRAETADRFTSIHRFPPLEVAAEPGQRAELLLSMDQIFVDTTADEVQLRLSAVDQEGRRSPPSDAVDVTRAEALPPPGAASARSVEAGVELSWAVPAGAPDEVQYHVYRREVGAAGWSGPALAEGPEHLDGSVVYGASYEYEVRAWLPGSKPTRESVASGIVRVDRLDRFPPGSPEDVRAVAGENEIRIFWFPPPDADLGGFRLYRAARQAEATRVADLPADATFHADHDVTPGVRYHYTVTAIDQAEPPNESDPSARASETGPRPHSEEEEEQQP